MITIKCLDEPFKKQELRVEVQGDKLILKDNHGAPVGTEDMDEVVEKIQLRGMSGDTRHIVLPYKDSLLRFKQYGKAIRYLQNAVDAHIARKNPESVGKIRKNGLSQTGVGALFMVPALVVVLLGHGGVIFYGLFLIGLIGVGMGLTNIRRSMRIQKMIANASA
jgi:hypothetical protein